MKRTKNEIKLSLTNTYIDIKEKELEDLLEEFRSGKYIDKNFEFDKDKKLEYTQLKQIIKDLKDLKQYFEDRINQE